MASGTAPGTVLITYWSPRRSSKTTVGATLDEEGKRFVFDQMPLGDFVIRITASGYAPKDAGYHSFSEGETTHIGQVELTAGATVVGSVFQGKKAVGAGWVVSVEGHEVRTATDDKGEFRLQNVPLGKLTLSLLGPDGSVSWRRNLKVKEGQTYRITIQAR